MQKQEMLALIGQMVNEKRAQNSLGPMEIGAEDRMLGDSLGIDSLDLAAIVVELEERTGRDPFANGIVNFQTAGALADLYAD
jgi:acyl carrier protein